MQQPLPRKTFIGNGHFEMPDGWARLDDGERDEAARNEQENDHRNHRAKSHGGYVETVSGTEQRHGAGKLPVPRATGNRLRRSGRIA